MLVRRAHKATQEGTQDTTSPPSAPLNQTKRLRSDQKSNLTEVHTCMSCSLTLESRTKREGGGIEDISSTAYFTRHYRWCPSEVLEQRSHHPLYGAQCMRRGTMTASSRRRHPTIHAPHVLCVTGASSVFLYSKQQVARQRYPVCSLLLFRYCCAASLCWCCCRDRALLCY